VKRYGLHLLTYSRNLYISLRKGDRHSIEFICGKSKSPLVSIATKGSPSILMNSIRHWLEDEKFSLHGNGKCLISASFQLENNKMLRYLRTASLLGLIILLAACGGGSADTASSVSQGSNQTSTKLSPTEYTSEGRTINSCELDPACSGNPYAPFFADLRVAPPNGATVSGIVRLEISGNELGNVELLPASGYTPRQGVFNITGDKVIAWMDVDTTKLPNGPFTVRISAFDVGAGQPNAREIVVMPARTWNISNATVPSNTLTATVTSAPADGAVVSGITHLEIHGSGIVNAELVSASGYIPQFGVFNVSADRTMAWLDLDTRTLADGVRDVRILAYNVTQGQPGAQQVVAMPARRWQFSNGAATAQFNGSVTMAPPNGDIISGRVRFEVRGSGIANAELLPANGYTPIIGTFIRSADNTFAWLEIDTTQLPNGVLEARISDYNVGAGQPNAKEVISMPVRQWTVQN
jgi:hypothetical protein